MSRLIDADELKKAFDFDDDAELEVAVVHYGIDHAPTIDAVPVVRCKDCKYRKKGGLHRSEKDGWSVVYDVPCDLGDDGFCSRGEMR